MSLLQNSNAISTGGAYNLESSLRFRRSANAYLSRTPTTAGNRKTFTFSLWFKGKGYYTGNDHLIGVNTSSTSYARVYYGTAGDNYLRVNQYVGGVNLDLTTTQVLRDPSAWYHLVVAFDTTQATASNRIKVYLNGEQITSFSTATYPSQNFDTLFNTTNEHRIGTLGATYNTGYEFDGYMTEVNFVDGQALDPTSFGETNDNGVWSPIAYTGTYGTNGFYLNFSDGTSTTTLGYDYSGSSNNWTTNNISLTAGSTYDLMSDTPSLADEDTGNFATLNPLNSGSGNTVSEANLKIATASTGAPTTYGTIAVSSGKWYWEFIPLSLGVGVAVGIAETTTTNASGFYSYSTGYGYYSANGQKYTSGSGTAYGATFTVNDVIGIALDLDAGTLEFYKNGVSQGTAYTGLSGEFTFAVADGGTGSISGAVNFGQRPFAYTPPTGYKKLNTFNLPDSSITDGSQYFDINLYTGNGATQTFTNLNFSPDFIWTKKRDSITNSNHGIQDSVRGVYKNLFANVTNVEVSSINTVTSYDSNGYQIGDNQHYNSSGNTFVSWNWRASDSTAVSNTDGTITSQVSANPTSGFSIVSWTGNGTAGATIGHGLGVAPSVLINKNRDLSNPWVVYHSSNTSAPETDYLVLNTTAATADNIVIWNDTAPTSDVFTVGSSATMNGNGNDIITYCFAEVEGFSKFGSYTGNGSTDGTFVYTGFRPAFVMVKQYTTTGNWIINDSGRAPYNLIPAALYPNLSNAEDSSHTMDLLSNGFKLRSTGNDSNGSGTGIIYMAFAENPFKNSLAR
jgi:hypothetical protein